MSTWRLEVGSMWNRWSNGLASSFAVAVCVLLPARVGASDPLLRRIDPLLRAAPSGSPSEPELVAIVRLPGLDAAARAALEAEGLRFRRAPDGRTRRLGALYPVEATRTVLARLARRGIWVRVSRPLAIGPALYPSAIETQAMDLAGHGPTPTQGPLGKRIMLGSIDSGINIFHPHFFRADGGAWPWVDVDDDGAFTPGIDAIDANLDGEIEPSETLQLLDYGFDVGQNLEGYGNTFQTAWDYLYIDSDDDGERDFGPSNGYSEASPGYGEPMFLPDDANGDGELGLDERIVLLGTSQVAGIRAVGQVWTRGVDLISAPPDATFVPNAAHGTTTSGIMTGGQTHPFRANRGHVPDADIAVVSWFANEPITDDFMVEGMAWLTQDMQAVVVNHSWGTRGDREHQDGSNVIDAVIDAATDEGAVQVCCAGNRHDKGKHRATTTSEGVASFTAILPSPIYGIVPSEITFDLHWPAAEGSFTCTVERPDGATHVVQEAPDGVFDGLNVDAFRADSDRGWALLSIRISNPGGGAVGSGSWDFACTHDGESEFLAHALVADGITYMQSGAYFIDATASSTMVSPAVADGCISVAGYPIQYSQNGAALGDLEPYSSAGPRFDGAMSVDIAAPVDAVAPTNDPEHPNAYTAFSGTSGSAPMVSAIAGLMKALDPELDPQAIEQRIQAAGAVDDHVGQGELPDVAWGYGKLRGYQAFTGEAPPPRPGPEGIDLVVDYAYADGACAAMVSVDGVDWEDASFRWDDEYDGIWETDFVAEDSRVLVFDDEGATFQVRVDAGERGFIVAGAVLTGEVPASCFVPPPDGGTGTSTSVDDTGDDAEATDDDDDGSGGDTTPQAGGDDGCGCRQRSPSAFGMFGLGWLALSRRRRRPEVPPAG